MESLAKSLSYDFTYLRQEFLEILNNFTEELEFRLNR